MRAELISVGTELLSGGVADTNSLYLSDELMLVGIETAFKTVVGDDERDMEEAFHRAFRRVNVVVVTGGIGPTEDDITRKVIAKIIKKRLVLNEEALKSIHDKLAGRGKEFVMSNDRQALIPAGARLLPNPVGIAPGFYSDEEDQFIAVLPGVPQEMRSMFSDGLRSVLEERFGGKMFIRRRTLRTCGVSESAVNQSLQIILKRGVPVVGLTATDTGVDIRIVSSGTTVEQSQALVDSTDAAIRSNLADAVYGVDDQELEEVVGVLLKQRRLKIAVAESCTGGLISGRITNIAGSSEYFERAAVVYSNSAKTEMLGVPQGLIERHGAVSNEVAEAMASGIKQAARTDLGLAVTGIAGPGGGSEIKPVGLVCIALASAQGVNVVQHRFLGTREQVRIRASQMALDLVRRYLIA
jgi:nicotinamide-nucleotide amidase